MYKIDWDILWRESEDDRFTAELRELVDKNPGIKMIGAKRDYEDDIEYIDLEDGRIIASDGHSPIIINKIDYYSDGDVILVDKENDAFVLDEASYIYTARGKYQVIHTGKDNYFAVDEDGKECLVNKMDVIDEVSRQFYLHLGAMSKEDAIRKLDEIKNILINK